MGIETALIIGAVASAASVGAGIVAGNKSRAAARHANDLQEQASNEARAGQAQQAAQAARDQYRQDRIRRARILQSSYNTGDEASSGEGGALGSLQTQYSTNQGNIASGYQRSQTIGNLQSQANQTIFDAQQSAGTWNNIGSIFQGVGSLSNAFAKGYASQLKIPGTTPQAAA